MTSSQETKAPPGPKTDYDLHIRVPGEMKETLKDSAELAYKMELIEKPELTPLMNSSWVGG